LTNQPQKTNTQSGGRGQHPASVFLRGMAMGAADVVPGVSGGTIAFITGIYFRLLEAISAIPGAVFRDLFRGKLRAFWQACDGTFLSTLLAGILTSIVTMASGISFLLAEYPILIWSFFFGLILASVWHVGRQARHYRASLLIPLIIGIVVAWWITTLSVGQLNPSALTFFAAGAVAICAMILPGISGSFILVIVGMYTPVLAAIKSFDVAVLLLFMAGCLVGLLSVARLITWAFHKYHDHVLALLTGFMIGALNKVWPWKETLSWRTNSSGEQVPLTEVSISPGAFADLTGLDPQIATVAAMVIVGVVLVLLIEWFGGRYQKAEQAVSDNAG
jgi:putative membrane protein